MKRQSGFHRPVGEWMIVVAIILIIAVIVIPQYQHKQEKMAANDVKRFLQPLREAVQSQLKAGTQTIHIGNIQPNDSATQIVLGRPQVSPSGEISVSLKYKDRPGILTQIPHLEREPGKEPVIYWRCTSTVFSSC